MLVTLQIVLLILIVGSTAFYAWCAIAVGRFFATPRPETNPNGPPVSVMIPVCGVDEYALENWSSFCQQDYENYEVLFGVMDSSDPAVPLLKDLVAKFPNRAKLFVGLDMKGINYQVSNLIHLFNAAQHEIVVITDSDMRVGPNYLRTVTAPLGDPEVGVVTCGYVAHEPKFWVAALAAMGRCIDFIPSILLSRTIDGAMKVALGATLATRKSVLEKIGGLQSLVNRVASDFQIGSKAASAGYRVELSQYVLETDSGRESFMSLFRRELRWSRSSRFLRGSLYYGLAFTHGSVYCIPLLLLSGFQSWAAIVCGITLAVRITQALVAVYSMGCPKLVWWLWALPIRDLTSFAVFMGGAFGQRIYWRGRQLQLGVGGGLTE
ncbi:MAG TPA: glycosyltransferase [Waterburya sp.]|jgi:ceramide glucosyltransferase